MLAVALVAGALVAVAAAPRDAGGVTTCLRSTGVGPPECQGRLMVEMGGRVEPGKLPRHRRAPVALSLEGKISLTGEGHPSALREMVFDLDRDITIEARGLAVCQGGRDLWRSLTHIANVCRDEIVGRGHADFEVAFPEQEPIRVSSKVVVLDNTAKGKPVTLLAVAEVKVPRPTIVSMPIQVSGAHGKEFGLSAVMKVPVIAGGSGSLLDFKFRIKRLFRHGGQRRSLVAARCADGVFKLGFPRILFRNEAHTPGVPATTLARGGLAIPCNPMG